MAVTLDLVLSASCHPGLKNQLGPVLEPLVKMIPGGESEHTWVTGQAASKGRPCLSFEVLMLRARPPCCLFLWQDLAHRS